MIAYDREGLGPGKNDPNHPEVSVGRDPPVRLLKGIETVGPGMSADTPTRDELTRGMTVEVEQENGDRIVGEVGAVLTDERTHPEGILVKLKSGVQGRVKRVAPGE